MIDMPGGPGIRLCPLSHNHWNTPDTLPGAIPRTVPNFSGIGLDGFICSLSLVNYNASRQEQALSGIAEPL